MKKILVTFIIIGFLILSGCESLQYNRSKLEAPVIYAQETYVKWYVVYGADEYDVYINQKLYQTVKTCQIDLRELELGTYHIYVIAKSTSGEYLSSDQSNMIEYVENIEQTRLDTPVLQINENILTWNEIEKADEYYIYKNGVIVSITTETKTVFDLYSEPGTCYQIQAINQYSHYHLNSKLSNTVIYEGIIEVKEINIFMINDNHGAFINDEKRGVDNLSSLLKELEKDTDYIKVANGDILQGSYVSNILYGLPMIDALNEMDFDAFIIGNHEFDWGLNEIAKYKDGDYTNGEAEFPFLGANIIDKNTGERPNWIEPYTIINKGNSKVGIIGVIGHDLESSILAENIRGFEFIYPVELIKEYANLLRTKYDCDSVIVSTHGQDDALLDDLAKLSNTSRIDAILCGHTHQKENYDLERSDDTVIKCVQNYGNSSTAVSLTLEVNIKGQLESSSAKHYYVNQFANDGMMSEVINRYYDYIVEANRVIGTVNIELDRQILGLYAVTAMKEEYAVDVAIMNTGGIRSTIDSGEITVAEVYEVSPFNNEIILTSLSGKLLRSLYENNFLFLYLNEDFDINNLEDSVEYSIAVIDYVYTGVYYSEFINTNPIYTNCLARDLLLKYLDDLY